MKWGIVLSADFPKKVDVFDTTLRDGEQTPGVSLTPDNKLRIARSLDKLGVDFIEAGFPAVSEGEMKAVTLVANEGLTAQVYGFARGVKKDIDALLRSGAQGVNLCVPTSDLHLEHKMKRKKEDILRIVETSTQYAKDHGLTVEFLAEDATRSDIEFITEVFEAAVSTGADKLCPCDTVGVLTPEKTFHLYRRLRKVFPDIPLGVHCHNDFGLAVANSITALRSGATEVHVTMNGLGERAGNASLEEIVVALKILYGVELPIKMARLYETSSLVARLTDFYIQPNKAIVGENAFVHESGMHTHGVLAHPLTYEPIAPELVGRTRRLASGKHAGSHGIKASLTEIGIHPNADQLKEIFLRVKTLGDKGKRVTDPDLQAIAEAVMELPRIRPIQLEELTVVTGDKVTPTASVRLSLNGSAVTEAATGVGPVDAAMAAVRKAVSAVEPIQLENYSVKAITGGTNAITEVAVLLRKGQRTATAIGVNEDIVTASVEAMLSGMNVLMVNYNQKKETEEP